MSYQKMRTKNLIRNILIGISALLLISCEDTYYEKEPFISFDWDVRLPIDENGYYHLEMDRNNFQTLHRISGNVGEENIMVNWESDLYWVLGDTLGYIAVSYTHLTLPTICSV